MSLTYIGDCSFQLAKSPERRARANDVPTITETWVGRTDQKAAFLASYATGSSYGSGYLVDYDDTDHTPGPGLTTIKLTFANQPNVQVTQSPSTFSVRTAVKSATVIDGTIYPGVAQYYVAREVTYQSPTTKYRYFASSQPSAPRFANVNGVIRILKDNSTIDYLDSSFQYNAKFPRLVIPTAQLHPTLKEAVPLTTQTNATIDADPIDGTPFWRCTDTVTKDYKSDSDS